MFLSCSTQSKYDQFWSWFSENQHKYYSHDNTHEHLYDQLNLQLKLIDENLTFEFGPQLKNGVREFIISADGIKESFSSVTLLVDKAPKLKNWKVLAFRQRISGDDISIVMGATNLSYDDIYFKHEIEGNKVNLTLYIQNYKDIGQYKSATYILLDGLIGEFDMETKVGWIEFRKLNENENGQLLKIIKLREIVDEIK